MTLTVTSPEGVTDYVPVTNPPDVTGDYRVTYLPAAAGHYEWSAVTTVPNAAYGDSFNVRQWRSILSLADAKEYLDLRDTSRDNVLRATLAGITPTDRTARRHLHHQNRHRRVGTRRREDLDPARRGARSSPSPPSRPSTRRAPRGLTADLIVNPAAGTVRLASLLPMWFGPWKATYTAGRAEIPADVIEGAKAALYDLWGPQRGVSADRWSRRWKKCPHMRPASPPGGASRRGCFSSSTARKCPASHKET